MRYRKLPVPRDPAGSPCPSRPRSRWTTTPPRTLLRVTEASEGRQELKDIEAKKSYTALKKTNLHTGIHFLLTTETASKSQWRNLLNVSHFISILDRNKNKMCDETGSYLWMKWRWITHYRMSLVIFEVKCKFSSPYSTPFQTLGTLGFCNPWKFRMLKKFLKHLKFFPDN